MSTTYQLDLLPGEPIIFVQLGSNYSFQRDFPVLQAKGRDLLNASSQRLFMVFDARELHLSFDDLVQGVNTSSRGEGSLFHHPNIAGIIGVSTNAMIKLAVKGMNSEIFGNVNVRIFETPEEALACAREQAAISAG